MRRSYGLLLAATLALALALVFIGRAPRRGAEPPRATAPLARAVPLTIEIEDGTISPAASSVPKGRHVALRVWNRGRRPARLTLAGYEDRLDLGPIAPGGAAAIEFHADRPGEDFPWLVDGEARGTLTVSGSHLEEGRE